MISRCIRTLLPLKDGFFETELRQHHYYRLQSWFKNALLYTIQKYRMKVLFLLIQIYKTHLSYHFKYSIMSAHSHIFKHHVLKKNNLLEIGRQVLQKVFHIRYIGHQGPFRLSYIAKEILVENRCANAIRKILLRLSRQIVGSYLFSLRTSTTTWNQGRKNNKLY